MTAGGDIYVTLDNLLAATIAGQGGFTELVQSAPVFIPHSIFGQREQRLNTIHAFLDVTMQVFRDVVQGKCSPSLSRLLMNDAPSIYGVDFHERIPTAVWAIPAFFRTDEAPNGQILEIQCPGSGWGDLQLLIDAYALRKVAKPCSYHTPSKAVAEDVVDLCRVADPAVLHLLDNASNPCSMRYLIATSQPPLRYWGYDRTVRIGQCDFVRSHSFFGLVAENLFRNRVRAAADGKVRFDLPPLLIFDQKTPLCLPFLEETRARYSDEIRALLAYSYPVSESGFRDSNGTWITIEDFLRRPPAQRHYFLKYAGCDVTLNWGSRGVYRLCDRKAPQLLAAAVADSRRDRPWIVQPEISDKQTVLYRHRATSEETRVDWNAKLSCFYSPRRLIGIRTMHRHHFKVHGQPDTIVGLALPDDSNTPGTSPFSA